MVDAAALGRAAAAVRNGELVVYPTETVFGLGADALSPAAVERVYDAKRRDRHRPVSMALPSVESIPEFAAPTERERSLCREFLPGPVTVVLAARDRLPAELLGGRDRVGVRVPDHDVALALLERVAPITATSANVSGQPSATRVADLDPEVRRAAAVVLEGGETPGGGSTVVDVSQGAVLREGHIADAVRDWLATG